MLSTTKKPIHVPHVFKSRVGVPNHIKNWGVWNENCKIVPQNGKFTEVRHSYGHLDNQYTNREDTRSTNMTSFHPLPYKSHQSHQR